MTSSIPISGSVKLGGIVLERSSIDGICWGYDRYLAEQNADPKPLVWTADPDRIIAAVKRGHQVLDWIQ